MAVTADGVRLWSTMLALPRIRPALVGIMAAIALAAGSCESAANPLGADSDLRSTLDEFVQLLNTHREALGCPALVWHPATADVAQAHSEDMVARSFFSHTNPDGLSPFDRLAAAGITYRLAGENIAAGYQTPSAVFEGWLGSPGHRANIENCGFTGHGIGLEDSHWTHMFLTPY